MCMIYGLLTIGVIFRDELKALYAAKKLEVTAAAATTTRNTGKE